MLEETTRILLAIRDIEGPDVQGVGPDFKRLMAHEWVAPLDLGDLLAGLEEGEAFGYLRISRGIGSDRFVDRTAPPRLREIVGVAITERGQEYCDDLLT